MIERQLHALQWLQELVARAPQATDGLAQWLNPSLARRLERAQIVTLQALVEHMNALGARWWVTIPGIGKHKAEGVVQWLHENQRMLGLHVGIHVLQARKSISPQALAEVVAPATAIRPLEKLVVPPELDGRAGAFRAPVGQCRIGAVNDREAIDLWLASLNRAGPSGAGCTATQRSYRKEAERLVLWAILEKGQAVSSLTACDMAQFREFLLDPPETWCGPRHRQRWSPLWRPLEGALSTASLRQCLIIVRSLFAYLLGQGYLVVNPMASMQLPGAKAPAALTHTRPTAPSPHTPSA